MGPLDLLNIYQVLVEFSMATSESIIRINGLLAEHTPMETEHLNKIMICWKKHGSYD
jgi:hypothetical protein